MYILAYHLQTNIYTLSIILLYAIWILYAILVRKDD